MLDEALVIPKDCHISLVFATEIPQFSINSCNASMKGGYIVDIYVILMLQGVTFVREINVHLIDTYFVKFNWDSYQLFVNLLLSFNAGLILGLHPANERRRHKVTPSISHWLGANLESALQYLYGYRSSLASDIVKTYLV